MQSTILDLFRSDPELSRFETVRRPYRNAVVRFRRQMTMAERIAALEEAHLNVFLFRADHIDGCDLLSDSGSGAMTAEQWARLMLGDESYGSNEGYFEMKEQIAETYGEGWANHDARHPNMFLFHQGRAAENALFTNLHRLLGPRQDGRQWVIPSNGHFDTTEANIQANGIEARNHFCKELESDGGDDPCHFKGNMDLEGLARTLSEDGDRVPLVYLTVTNNTGGGQPVSMANIQAVQKMAADAGLPFFLDACRFAENAWFIKRYEEGYAERSIPSIVHAMFAKADGFTISLKKDGVSNMGGALLLREGGRFLARFPTFPDRLADHQILVEGHPTYGGLTGRDIKAIAEGLRTVVREDYLAQRVGQVQDFGAALAARGVPVVEPFGGSAVYLKMDEFFADTKHDAGDFPGIALTALLLLMGHRLCELGHFAFGHFDGEKEHRPEVNYVRAAVPRLAYADQDLANCAEAVAKLHALRHEIPGVDVTFGRDLTLRHFKAHFSFK